MNSLYSKPVDARANRRRFQLSVAIFLLPTLVYPLIGGAVEGRATTEKILTAWCMPLGVVWLSLLLLTLFLWNQRLVWSTRLSLVCFLLLTVTSNGILAGWLIGSLESKHKPWRLDQDPPLDVVVVLGGNTNSSPAYGRVEAGDRIVYGAEIFQQHKTSLLIATGASSIPNRPHPGEVTKQLWMRLGIPEASIQVLGGPNTFAEFQELKATLGNGENRRIGVLSSAFHIPRVMRLANSSGLQVIPIAADHRHDPEAPIRFQSFMPSDDAMVSMRLALKEYLAAIVNR